MSGARSAVNEADIDLRQLFGSLARNASRISLFVLAATALAFIAAWQATPHYRAEARILIESREPAYLRPATDEARWSLPDEELIASQVEIVSSADILRQVAHGLDLTSRAEFGETGAASRFETLLVFLGLRSDVRRVPAGERRLEAMRERLSVSRLDRSRVIAVRFSSTDAQLAAEMPNAVAGAYVAMLEQAKDMSASQAERPGLRLGDRGLYLPAGARVFSRATRPSEPYFPKVLPVTVAAFVGSLLTACAFTLLAEFFSGRAMRLVHRTMEPVEIVLMPAGNRAPGEASPAATFPQPSEPGRNGLSAAAVADRLIAAGAARAAFISPEGGDAAAASVTVARRLADTGRRVLFMDLSPSGAPSASMLESTRFSGITNLLAAEAQFAEIIRGDLHSDCHVVPAGTAGIDRAMRAIDRLPIIMASLTTAYDLVVVECGAMAAEAVARIADRDAEIFVSASDADAEIVRRTTADLAAAGYARVSTVVSAGQILPRGTDERRAAA